MQGGQVYTTRYFSRFASEMPLMLNIMEHIIIFSLFLFYLKVIN